MKLAPDVFYNTIRILNWHSAMKIEKYFCTTNPHRNILLL